MMMVVIIQTDDSMTDMQIMIEIENTTDEWNPNQFIAEGKEMITDVI